jgi:hypothetical protein
MTEEIKSKPTQDEQRDKPGSNGRQSQPQDGNEEHHAVSAQVQRDEESGFCC